MTLTPPPLGDQIFITKCHQFTDKVIRDEVPSDHVQSLNGGEEGLCRVESSVGQFSHISSHKSRDFFNFFSSPFFTFYFWVSFSFFSYDHNKL
jgi:hypothetical protein